MPDMRESLYWDKALEADLPDTRLRYGEREKLQRRLGRMDMDVVFCAQCGGEFGLVPVHCSQAWWMTSLIENSVKPRSNIHTQL